MNNQLDDLMERAVELINKYDNIYICNYREYICIKIVTSVKIIIYLVFIYDQKLPMCFWVF